MGPNYFRYARLPMFQHDVQAHHWDRSHWSMSYGSFGFRFVQAGGSGTLTAHDSPQPLVALTALPCTHSVAQN